MDFWSSPTPARDFFEDGTELIFHNTMQSSGQFVTAKWLKLRPNQTGRQSRWREAFQFKEMDTPAGTDDGKEDEDEEKARQPEMDWGV